MLKVLSHKYSNIIEERCQKIYTEARGKDTVIPRLSYGAGTGVCVVANIVVDDVDKEGQKKSFA